jgi:hypothetical protein
MLRRLSCTEDGASEGIRTLDTHVGNVMLYQAELRSLPNELGQATRTARECKLDFSEIFRKSFAEPLGWPKGAALSRVILFLWFIRRVPRFELPHLG